MSNKQFFNNLSATYADVRKLDVKKINLKGKNILEYISENKTTVLDERGTNADDELDIWNSYVTEDENGNVIINRSAKPKEHDITTVTDEQLSVLRSCTKVINNEVLDADDNHLMYWQTDGLTIGHFLKMVEGSMLPEIEREYSIFYEFDNVVEMTSDIQIFNSNLSSLTTGNNMFASCSNLTTFTSDLSSLTTGYRMFDYCRNLTTFASDSSGSPVNLSSLVDGS